MKRILVPLDGSKNSFRGLTKAIDISKKDQTKIVALHIVQISPSFTLRPTMKIVKDAKKILNIAKSQCKKHGITFEYKLISGFYPGHYIIKFSQKHKFDMIVIGARGLGSLKEVFLGSTSNYVVHKSKIPVLLVK